MNALLTNATPEEIEAVRLRYRALNPNGPPEPPPGEFDALLLDIRQRAQAIESEAILMLNQKLREGRRTPRRHMRFAFFVVFPIMAIGLALVYFYNR